jgi:hypothetical protein
MPKDLMVRGINPATEVIFLNGQTLEAPNLARCLTECKIAAETLALTKTDGPNRARVCQLLTTGTPLASKAAVDQLHRTEAGARATNGGRLSPSPSRGKLL